MNRCVRGIYISKYYTMYRSSTQDDRIRYTAVAYNIDKINKSLSDNAFRIVYRYSTVDR